MEDFRKLALLDIPSQPATMEKSSPIEQDGTTPRLYLTTLAIMIEHPAVSKQDILQIANKV